MKKFLDRLNFSLIVKSSTLMVLMSMGLTSQAKIRVEKPLQFSSLEENKQLPATMTVNVEGVSMECKGNLILGSFSILGCGEKKQVRVEVQTVNSNQNAILSIYEFGRSNGELYLAKREDTQFRLLENSEVRISGFGYAQTFIKFIYFPISKKLGEEKAVATLPSFIESMSRGGAPTIATLQNEVDREGYLQFVPKEEPKPVEQNPSEKEIPAEKEDPSKSKTEPAPKEESSSKESEPKKKAVKEKIPVEPKVVEPKVEEQKPPRNRSSSSMVIRYLNPYDLDLEGLSLKQLKDLEDSGLIVRLKD